jgi:excisionase family DNA binding protein
VTIQNEYFLSIKDVAEVTTVNPRTVRRWLVNGNLPSYHVGRRRLIGNVDLVRWLAQFSTTELSTQAKQQAAEMVKKRRPAREPNVFPKLRGFGR